MLHSYSSWHLFWSFFFKKDIACLVLGRCRAVPLAGFAARLHQEAQLQVVGTPGEGARREWREVALLLVKH